MTSLVVLADVILDQCDLMPGVRGRKKRSNTRAMDGGGFVKINVNWSRSLREWDIGFVAMVRPLWQILATIHEVTDGGAYGFLLQDPEDSTVASGEGVLQPWDATSAESVGTVGLGYGVPTLRTNKRYTYGSRTYDRLLTRPMAGLVVRRGGVVVTEGAGAGQIAIDVNTGTITFVADASQAIASITTGASTVLTFANSSGIQAVIAVGQRVYITGVTGTAAAALNGLSHPVTAEDTGAFTLTIATSTTGLSGAAGTAAKYPQADETLTWTGGYYVPVHFATDDLDWEMVYAGPDEDARLIAGPNVTLMEVREA